MLPTGTAQGSSVQAHVNAGNTVKKGDWISNFEYDGSDIVYLFPASEWVYSSGAPNQEYLVGKRGYRPVFGTGRSNAYGLFPSRLSKGYSTFHCQDAAQPHNMPVVRSWMKRG